MNKILISLCILCSSPLYAQIHDKTIRLAHVVNVEVFQALQNVKTSLLTDRTPLLFESGESSKNCADYLKYSLKSRPSESIRNFEIKSEYLQCDAIGLISNASFVFEKNKLAPDSTKIFFERLDIRTFPSSIRNRTNEKQHTLKALLVGKVKLGINSIQVETNENILGFEIVAVIDQPGSGKQTLVVWFTDEVKGGDYHSYNTLVIKDYHKKTKKYTAKLYPPQS